MEKNGSYILSSITLGLNPGLWEEVSSGK